MLAMIDGFKPEHIIQVSLIISKGQRRPSVWPDQEGARGPQTPVPPLAGT